MSRHRRRTASTSIKVAVATAAAAAVGLTATLVPAEAAAEPVRDTGGDAAVITPLLNIFNFGATVGLPLACNLVTSLVPAFAPQLSDLTSELADQCQKLSDLGGGFLAQAIQQSGALTLINPLLNPIIAGISEQVANTGSDQAATLSPFGPTIAGLGGTIAFFEGTTSN